MNRAYLVPANSEKQNLIFGFLLPVDAIILGIGIAITFLLLMIFPVTELWGVIVTLLPALIAGFLVFPVPNYHNSRILLREIYYFYFKSRRKYVWRGWCYKYEQSDEQ